MDDLYLATLSVYQWVIGQTIAFHLTWPDHPRYTVEQGEGSATLTAVDGAQRVYTVDELEKNALITDARAFILDHANTQGLQRGKHSTWRGAEWCKVRA